MEKKKKKKKRKEYFDYCLFCCSVLHNKAKQGQLSEIILQGSIGWRFLFYILENKKGEEFKIQFSRFFCLQVFLATKQRIIQCCEDN